MSAGSVTIRTAVEADIPQILTFIRGLAGYERLAHEVRATEDDLRRHLFGPRRSAEVLLAGLDGRDVGFALFFETFSTFLGRPGMHLEDLFVDPTARGRGVGRALLAELACLCVERGYGRMEWVALGWNEPAARFYRGLGAGTVDDWHWFRLTAPGLTKLCRQAENRV